MMLPKPTPKPKIRKPMNRIGPVGRRRLAANKKRPEINHCEIGPILKQRGITFVRCLGDLTWAHSVKAHKRGRDPELEKEVARSCETHHYYVLDLLRPELTAEIVREAIRRRDYGQTAK